METFREVNKSSENYVQHLEYTLKPEDLKNNKYPQEEMSICSDYENTKNWPKLASKKQNMNILTIDCEMVESIKGTFELARISILNYDYEVVYESYVKPTSQVKDYLTA